MPFCYLVPKYILRPRLNFSIFDFGTSRFSTTLIFILTSKAGYILNNSAPVSKLKVPFYQIFRRWQGTPFQELLTARLRKPTMSEAVHAPEWSTLCAGISPSSVGISSTTVSVVPGYCVRWPWELTLAVSAAKTTPYSPPWMYAPEVLLVGRLTYARPDMKMTHLWCVSGNTCTVFKEMWSSLYDIERQG